MVYSKVIQQPPINLSVESLNASTDDLEALVGEKAETPSLFSELDRLKKIKEAIDLLSVKLNSIIANTDELEGNTIGIGTPLQNAKIPNPIPQEAITFEPKISLNKDNVGIAKEITLDLIKTKTNNLDITLTALKNFLKGADNNDFTTLYTAISALFAELQLKAKLTETQPVSNIFLNLTLTGLRDGIIDGIRGLGNNDLTTLQDVLSLVKTNLDNLNIENELPLQIDTDGFTTYIGYALVGSAKSVAMWRIKKVITTGDDISITFADGNKLKDNIWDNRLTLTYS